VTAHHPDVDILVVSSGLLELKEDGTPLTSAEFHEIGRSLRGLATAAAKRLKLDKFFYPCDTNNKPLTMPTKSKNSSQQMPASSTPATAEPPHPSSPAQGN
jgi:hypothetical protein